MRHFVFSMTKITGYLLSVLVILLAIVIIVLGVLTPYLNSRLPNVESWASQMLDVPITIESVHLSWYQYDPEISLNKVTVLSKVTHKPTLQIDKIHVFFSLWKSVWQHQPVLDGVMLAGADLVVKQNAQGEFIVQGFPAFGANTSQPYANESKFTDVVGWLSEQPRLYLQDVDVQYTGMNAQLRSITLYKLSLKNEGEKHTILGSAILRQAVPTKVTVAAQWLGNVLAFPNIQARVYLEVSGLSLSQWWKGLTYQGWQLKDGWVSAKTWGYWKQGQWQRIQSEATLYDASLYSVADHSTHIIDRLSGDFGWKNNKTQQIIAADDVLLDLPAHIWPATNFYMALTPTQTASYAPTQINTGYLNIQDVLSFALASPDVLSKDVRQWMMQSKISGDITHAAITLDPNQPSLMNAQLNIGLSHIHAAAQGAWPGVDQLSGQMQWDGKNGQFHLNSEDAQLTLNSVFEQPLRLGRVQGQVNWQQNAAKQWKVTIPNVSIDNDDLSLDVEKSTLLFDKPVPTANLQGSISVHRVEKIAPYFPLRVFSEGLGEWLKMAFLTGRAEDGQFVLKGNLADFPFDKNDGLFSVKAKAKDITLRYAEDWPIVENINADLDFTGRKMTILADEAHVYSITVHGVQAVIPNLGSDDPTILDVTNIHVNTDFSNGMRFVRESPLNKTLGRMFKEMSVSGPMVLDLALTVPLDNPDTTTVKGAIQLSDAKINLAPWRLTLDKLNGLVNFTEKSTDANALQGRLFGKSLTLSLATVAPKKAPPYVQATANTTIQLTDIGEWLHLPIDKVATGQTAVKALLNLGFDQPVDIQLQSDLSGIALKLPTPYAKTAEASVPFTADITIQDNQPLKAKVSYGQLVQAALLLQAKGEQFDLVAANVLLGVGNPDWPTGKGLTLTANFDTLDWATIQSYQSEMSGSSVSSLLPLNDVNVNAKKIKLLGQTITSASLNVKSAASSWVVNITSDQLAGSVTVPTSLSPKSQITANLSRLNLQSSSGSNASSPLMKADTIPALNINANNLGWNGMNLGSVSLSTAPTPSGMLFKSIQLRANGVSADASGSWTQSGRKNTTVLQGSVTATALSTWLSQLGLDAHSLVATKGQGRFDLRWQASPADLALKNMSGTAYISLGAGRIVDVGDTSGAKMDIGKMLSIFSLQTIPRRLSLDFSDVFQKGYSFDSFKGDFNFSNGNAVTNNTRFDGPVARVEIKGAIGLAAKNYDFTLSVTPYVTSSIPVAAAIISGPVAGVAALAVNKLIGSQIANATTYYYAVGGTWANPTWNELKTKPQATP